MRTGWKKVIKKFLVTIVLFVSFFSAFAIMNKNQNMDKVPAEELKRALTYGQITEEEEYVDANKFVKFGAFFTQDLNNDGYAERILGTCKNQNSTDTLYIDIGVEQEGYLENGLITIDNKNFYLSMEMLEDSVLAKKYLSSNVENIELKTINSGTQKIIMGVVRSKITESGDYSKINSITLTGTHVDNDGNRTEINKTIDLTIDWYGTATTSLTGKESSYYTDEFTEGENRRVAVNFVMDEVGLLNKENIFEVSIPSWNGIYPTEATCNYGTSEYDSENHILRVNHENNYKRNTYTIILTYPETATSATTLYLPIEGYSLCYNNPNEEFKNPYKTNLVKTNSKITIKTPYTPAPQASHKVYGEILGRTYLSDPYKYYAKSMDTFLEQYDSEEPENVTYEVRIGIERVRTDIDESTLEFTSDGDDFGNYNLNDFGCIRGIKFKNTSLIPSNGTIKIYDTDKNEVVAEFVNGQWTEYANKTYEFTDGIKNIKIVTSEDLKTYATFEIVLVKEVDMLTLKQRMSRTQLKNVNIIRNNIKATGSNIANILNVNYDCRLVYKESHIGLSIEPNSISAEETTAQNHIFSLSVPYADIGRASWKNGIYLIRIPNYRLPYIKINSVSSTDSKINIDGYELYSAGNYSFIKIITSNVEPRSGFNINVDCDILPNPVSNSASETITVFAYNEECKEYYKSTNDSYDLDGDENTSEYIGFNSVEYKVFASNTFTTVETVTEYDDENNTTVAPNVAEVSPETRQAKVNVLFANNDSKNVSNVVILGRVPFEGNTYINGGNLNSQFSAKMTDEGIILPDGLENSVTVYYSENQNPNKDLSVSSNGWKTKEEFSSLDNVKNYLIVFDNDKITKGRTYTISYNVDIPYGVEFNKASYSCHTIYYDINTSGGLLSTSIQTNKVGIRVVKYFDINFVKCKEKTDLPVSGAKYILTEEDENGEEVNSRIMISSNSGELNLRGLRVNQIYYLKEIQAPINYELNPDVIKFKLTEDTQGNIGYEILSTDTFAGDMNILSNPNGNDIFEAKLEDEPKVKITLHKKDAADDTAISGVIFNVKENVDGSISQNYITDVNGNAVIENLSVGKEYILTENYADGYYNIGETHFTINKENDVITCTEDSDFVTVGTITNPTDSAQIEVPITVINEKIPTYNLKIEKVDESSISTNLEGARYILKREDLDNSIYYTTDEEGKIEISGLYEYVEGKPITGKYTLQEVQAPNGYTLNPEEIEFVVSKNAEGKLQINITDENSKKTICEKEIVEDTVRLTLSNKPLFKLKKVDSETGMPLANVEFVVYSLDSNYEIVDFAKDPTGEYIGEQNEKGDYIVKTNEEGIITLPLPNGIYKAIEYAFLEGYEETTKYEIFTITGNSNNYSNNTTYDFNMPTLTKQSTDIEEISVTEIDSIEDLYRFSSSVNAGKNYKNEVVRLIKDLDFEDSNSYEDPEKNWGDLNGDGVEEGILLELTKREGKGFLPIGGSYYTSFIGIFDGQNHEIKNIYINSSGIGYVALFGKIENSIIANLKIDGEIKSNGASSTASLVASANFSSRVINCHNKANVWIDNGGTSGFAFANANVENCSNYGNLTYNTINASYKDKSNWLFIYALGTSSINSYNRGNITVNEGTHAVQIFGLGTSNTKNCYNTGNVTFAEDFLEDTSRYIRVFKGTFSWDTSENNYYLNTITSNYPYEEVGTEFIAPKTSEEMKSDEFIQELTGAYWKKDTENINDGYPIIEYNLKLDTELITEVNCIEDLVKISNLVNIGIFDYEKVDVKLNRELDFNSDDSYKNPNDKSFGDVNKDGIIDGIKEELTKSTGSGFSPIGNSNNYFKGNFDGQNYEIKNIYINSIENYAGLFGIVSSSALENISISGNITGARYVGGIAGSYYCQGIIENCCNKCNINYEKSPLDTSSYSSSYIGGIVGYCNYINSTSEMVSVKSCKNYGKISNGNYNGGIIGNNYSFLFIDDCKNYGEIISENNNSNYCGGILGNSYIYVYNFIKNCENNGNITGITCGGIIGDAGSSDNNDMLFLYNSENNGTISGKTIGGILGYFGGSGIFGNLANHGTIITSSTESVGGIFGYMYGNNTTMVINECYNDANITSEKNGKTGGVIGYLYNQSAMVTNCYNIGIINYVGEYSSNYLYIYLGGVIGYGYTLHTLSNCWNSGNINVTGNVTAIGGLVGYANSNYNVIANCYNTGNIKEKGISYNLGGLIGMHSYYITNGINGCYNTGNLEIDNNELKDTNRPYTSMNFGGLCGYNYCNITGCYNNGKLVLKGIIHDYINMGGISGGFNSNNYSCNNVYNTGDIEISNSAIPNQLGGIVGYTSSSQTINKSYNLGNITIWNVASKINSSIYIGGILGGYDGLVTNSYNKGNIDIKINENVEGISTIYLGGIIGYTSANRTDKRISGCYNSGNINNEINLPSKYISTYIGGIAGISSAIVEKSYNIGNIINKLNLSKAYTCVGGIVGNSYNNSFNINNAYNMGDISNEVNYASPDSSIYAGGIFGYSYYPISISSTYNTGNVRNTTTAMNGRIANNLLTAPIYGYIGTTTPQTPNYYLDSIEIEGSNSSVYNVTQYGEPISDSSLKSTEIYEEYSENSPNTWIDIPNQYPLLNLSSASSTNSSQSTELLIENSMKKYDVTTEVDVGSQEGGTISGDFNEKYTSSNGIKFVEEVKYGEGNTKPIVITSNSGYKISKITVNDKEISFIADENGNYTIPAGYFESVKENTSVKAYFVEEEYLYTINKTNENNEPLEGAVFRIGATQFSEDNLINSVKPNGRYVFGNYGDYLAPVSTGSSGNIANSYVKIDLSNKTQNYIVSVNAELENAGVLYAEVTNNENPINSNESTNFIYASGTQARKNYNSQVLTAGNAYYLHLGYIYNANTDIIAKINSIYLVPVDGETEVNVELTNNGDTYFVSSENEYVPNSDGTGTQSYAKIDLTDMTGDYFVVVKANNTSGTLFGDITSNTTAIEANANNFIYNSTAGDKYYLQSLTTGVENYLHIGYSGNASDAVIYSIKVYKVKEGFIEKTTNELGQIKIGLTKGTYTLQEKQAPIGYTLDPTIRTFTINENSEKSISVQNESQKEVIVHYYLKETGPEYNTEAVELTDDVVVYGDLGTEYVTTPKLEIDDYKLLKENDEYVIPENATGHFTAQTINVYYYYDLLDTDYTVHYFYDNQEDVSAVEDGTGKVGTTVENYEAKAKDGFKLYSEENLPLTLSADSDENVINIYYVKDAYEYKVNYYYNNDKEETITNTAIYGTKITTYEDKVRENYIFDKVEPLNSNGELELIVSDDVTQNVINVYYKSEYSITTEVVKHDENYSDGTSKVVEGGEISGQDNTVYETVLRNGNSTKEIEIKPFEGYVIGSIKIRNGKDSDEFVNVDLTNIVDDNGQVTLKPENGYFTNVQSDKHIEVEFKKISSVVVKYLEKDTEEVLATEEVINGYAGEEKTMTKKVVANYMSSNPAITDENGNEKEATIVLTGDVQTRIYWYERIPSGIIVRKIAITEEDLENGLTIDSGSEISSTLLEGFVSLQETITREDPEKCVPKDGPISNDENIIILGKDDTSVTVTYKEDKVVEVRFYYERQYDITLETKEHTENKTGAEEQVKGGHIEGEDTVPYEVVPAMGANTKEIVIVPDTGYRVKTILVNENPIDLTVFTEGENHVITIPTSYFTKVQEEKNVQVEFERIPARVIIENVDVDTNEVISREIAKTGDVGDPYEVEAKEIDYYRLVETPNNTSGIMTEKDIVVTYKYKRIFKITTKVILHDEILRPRINIPKDSDQAITSIQVKGGTISGDDEEVYETVERGEDSTKDIELSADENYRIVSVTKNGNEIDIKDEKGFVLDKFNNIQEDIDIAVKYEKFKFLLTVKYLDSATEEAIAEEEKVEGFILEEYLTKPKQIDGYELIEIKGKTEGILQDDVEIKYYYKKLEKKEEPEENPDIIEEQEEAGGEIESEDEPAVEMIYPSTKNLGNITTRTVKTGDNIIWTFITLVASSIVLVITVIKKVRE